MSMLPFQIILNYGYGYASVTPLNGPCEFGCRVTPVNLYRLSVATNKPQALTQPCVLDLELLTMACTRSSCF